MAKKLSKRRSKKLCITIVFGWKYFGIKKTKELVARKYSTTDTLYIYWLLKQYQLQLDLYHYQSTHLLRKFLNRFCNRISTKKAIQSLLLVSGLRRYYATSQYKYQLMHSSFLTQSTETQSWLLISDSLSTTFKPKCGYHFCVYYDNI